MKKLLSFILLSLLVISCEEADISLDCQHLPEVEIINPTTLYAQVEVNCISSIITCDPLSDIHTKTHVKLTGYWVCLIGKPITIYMYEVKPTGWHTLYYYTEIISDTVVIDSTKFKPYLYP